MPPESQNALFVYLLVAPVILFLAAAGGAYLFMRRPYPENKSHKPR